MLHLGRAIGILGLALSVAACSATGQGGALGQAEQTVRDHPQTAVGAGVGAAGGAVVGGVAGGTKGAVIGGLLGALAGGVIGNYVERREAAAPRSTTAPASGGTATGAATPGAPALRIEKLDVQPTAVRAGDTVNLSATYTVTSPSDQPVTVRETREVRLDGALVANPAVEVTRQTGTYSSALPITLPDNARPGRYDVTMTVAAGDRQSTSASSFSVQ